MNLTDYYSVLGVFQYHMSGHQLLIIYPHLAILREDSSEPLLSDNEVSITVTKDAEEDDTKISLSSCATLGLYITPMNFSCNEMVQSLKYCSAYYGL